MCLLMDDDEEGSGSGSPKLQLKRSHTWIIPRKVLMVILGLAIIFIFLGMILMAIGGGIGSTALHIIGGILFAFGIIGLVICLVVCLYAYFYYGTRDQAVQTEMTWTDEYADSPGYASIGRPSALKSADSTLRRNGTAGQKKVTMAPELGPYGESPPNALPLQVQGGNVVQASRPQMERSPSYGSERGFLGDGRDPRGPGGRNVAGSDVGSGGIRITTLDRNQPFPSPGGGSQSGFGGNQAYVISGGGQGYGGAGGGHVIYAGGGSSASSSMDANYAYPKSVSVISGPESGFSDSTSGSQYSTLRSIPVTHIVSDSQRQQQQRQQQETVEYARVNKQAKTAQTMNVNVPAQQGYIIQGQSQSGQFQQKGFPVDDDFDYDNPVERTPMIPPKQNLSYHEQQMQFQRQQRQPQHQQDLYAPRQVDSLSLQRQYGSNPYHLQQQQQQQQQQQKHQYQSSYSTSSRQISNDDLPEPQPLVYPSARRPMTFEQVSSSKMSVYDNVLAGLKDADEEE